MNYDENFMAIRTFVLNPMHEIFLILKNIVELHSILLALT